MQLHRREQDAIDRWLALQCRVWWKKWWWLVVASVVVAVWNAIPCSYGTFGLCSWTQPTYNFLSFISMEARNTSLFMDRFHYHFTEFLIVPTILIPLTLAGSIVFPTELVAAVGFNKLQQRKKSWILKSTWTLLAILHLWPGFLLVILSRLTPDLLRVSIIGTILCVLYLAIVLNAIAQWLVFITTRQLTNWTLGILVVVTIAAFYSYQYLLQPWNCLWDDGFSDTLDTIRYWRQYLIYVTVFLSATVFLLKANKAPQSYMAES